MTSKTFHDLLREVVGARPWSYRLQVDVRWHGALGRVYDVTIDGRGVGCFTADEIEARHQPRRGTAQRARRLRGRRRVVPRRHPVGSRKDKRRVGGRNVIEAKAEAKRRGVRVPYGRTRRRPS
jgi:hypothetical protein